MCIIDRSETDDREGKFVTRVTLVSKKSVTRVTLVSKKFVTRVSLAFNMTSFYQKQGEEREGYPRATRARAGRLYQNRKRSVNII